MRDGLDSQRGMEATAYEEGGGWPLREAPVQVSSLVAIAATSRTSVAADLDQPRPEDWFYGTEGAGWRDCEEVLESDIVEFVSDPEAPQQDEPASGR